MMYTFTFHAKHEGALRLMLIKCIAFHLSTDLYKQSLLQILHSLFYGDRY